MATVIKELLQRDADAWLKSSYVPWRELFVLRKGTIMQPRARIGSKRHDKNCFSNAFNAGDEIASDRGNPDDEAILYVEGFAKSPQMPLAHHAWVGIDGKAMDPTWREYMGSEYMGVPFNRKIALAEICKTGYFGLLAGGDIINTDLMFRFDPGLEAVGSQYLASQGEGPVDDRSQLSRRE